MTKKNSDDYEDLVVIDGEATLSICEWGDMISMTISDQDGFGGIFITKEDWAHMKKVIDEVFAKQGNRH